METQEVKRVALFIAVLAGFLTPFDLSGVNIALPTIGAEFSMDAIAMGWVPTAYLLASAVFLVPFGRIADIYGRKKIFISGLAIFALSSLAMVFSVSPTMIIALRVAQGMGSALIFGTAVAILTAVTPPGERGRALGIYTTAVYLGLSLGPFLGGFLTGAFGWRSIFLINLPLGLATIGLILWKLDGEWADAKGERFDLAGSVLYGITLVLVMYGFSLLPDIEGIALVVAGTIILALFVWWELRTSSPLLDLQLFARNRVFAFSNAAALINYSATFAITFFLSLYLQFVKGMTPTQAGFILVTQPLVMAIFASYGGRLSDRIEPRKVASVGIALNAIGLFMLVFIDASTTLFYLVPVLAVIGLGLALFSSPNTNAIMSSVDRRCLGVASGTLGTMRLVGQMLSMGIAMIIFAVFIGNVVITPEYYPAFLTGLRIAFSISTALCVIAIFFSLARGPVHEKEKTACKVR